MEDSIVAVRTELREKSLLGEFGAMAIRDKLKATGVKTPPSIRTIYRVLQRRGALDGRARVRRPPPPRGWYLLDVACRQAELDSFDFVEDLVIRGGPQFDVLTGISLHGGLPGAWPMAGKKAQDTLEAVVAHWQAFGCPSYAQFDNDTCFQGPHQHPDTLGRVTRLCLSLGVVPVFVPPRETGFQAAIENFNGRWQAKVWRRFEHASLPGLQEHNAQYIDALRVRSAARIETAPDRKRIPETWKLDLQARPRGRMVFLRRTNEHGAVAFLGHTFHVHLSWLHRLVRADFDLTAGLISFYALRRRAPGHQILLREVQHKVRDSCFHE